MCMYSSTLVITAALLLLPGELEYRRYVPSNQRTAQAAPVNVTNTNTGRSERPDPFVMSPLAPWRCPFVRSAVRHFRVLARMTPGLKEELATLLIESGKTVLM